MPLSSSLRNSVLLALTFVMVTGCVMSNGDDRKKWAKMVFDEGAMEVFKGRGTGSIVSAIASTPEATLDMLKIDLAARRNDFEYRATQAGDDREAKRLEAEADWAQANLDCITSGGKNCSKLQELTPKRKAAADARAAADKGGSDGHSH